ncbi:hypothetical protein EFP52_14635 [Lacticaseibacillus paracasei]|uniref:Uncharacterized protein n=1 Tax=Lacticaseibacillus paracasei subsp. paracasei Lpp123 TaxID=1256201 RepID=A0A829GAY0_LACPA|nr:hypothetical protein Lpp123_18355 [Lacticaseibacillus paracasei subsp. paracasei Lpp123]MCT3379748.1 hypothetical protein [Lacticaseibacillus paracasei]
MLLLYLFILIGVILDINIFLISRKLKKLNPSLTNKNVIGWQNKLLVDRQLSKLNPGFYETNKALHTFISSTLFIFGAIIVTVSFPAILQEMSVLRLSALLLLVELVILNFNAGAIVWLRWNLFNRLISVMRNVQTTHEIDLKDFLSDEYLSLTKKRLNIATLASILLFLLTMWVAYLLYSTSF